MSFVDVAYNTILRALFVVGFIHSNLERLLGFSRLFSFLSLGDDELSLSSTPSPSS